MAKKKVKEVEVIEGTHLTVTKHANGNVDLVWNWDALLNEVVAACGIVPVTEAKVKASRKKAAEKKPAAKKSTKKKVK